MQLIISMGKINKAFALLLTLTIAMSCLSVLIVKPTNAQTIPKPTVPQFTVEYLTQTSVIPATTPTYTIDPYSGQQKILNQGRQSYNVTSGWLELKIKNQPFTPYNNSDGVYISLYYNLRYKGHYETNWTYYPFNPDGISSKIYGGWDMTYLIPYTASNTEYTTITSGLDKLGIPNYGQVDFQVQAQIGYIQDTGDAFAARVWGIHYNFTGETSDWSNTQTVTISATSASSNPTSTMSPTPTVPEFTLLAIVLLLVAIPFVTVLLTLKRKRFAMWVRQARFCQWLLSLY
jgi:hypothetical protein